MITRDRINEVLARNFVKTISYEEEDLGKALMMRYVDMRDLEIVTEEAIKTRYKIGDAFDASLVAQVFAISGVTSLDLDRFGANLPQDRDFLSVLAGSFLYIGATQGLITSIREGTYATQKLTFTHAFTSLTPDRGSFKLVLLWAVVQAMRKMHPALWVPVEDLAQVLGVNPLYASHY